MLSFALHQTYLAVRLLGLRALARQAHQKLRRSPPAAASSYVDAVAHRSGLEIGGPSQVFQRGGALPIYEAVAGLDGCNFSDETLWQGRLSPGRTYVYGAESQAGWLFTSAEALAGVEPERYDFVVACHVIEHIANPLRALSSWIRIVKPSGVLMLVVPHYKGTFDHFRRVTPIAHLVEDFERDVDESDETHVEDFVRHYDARIMPFPGGLASLEERARDNLRHRIVHHHVFDEALVRSLLEQAGLRVLTVDLFWPFHIAALATKAG